MKRACVYALLAGFAMSLSHCAIAQDDSRSGGGHAIVAAPIRPIPSRLAAIVGKKFSTRPPLRYASDKAPAFAALDGWELLPASGSRASLLRPAFNWSRQDHARLLSHVESASQAQLNLRSDGVKCAYKIFAARHPALRAVALLAVNYCADGTVTVEDALPLKNSEGVTGAARFGPVDSDRRASELALASILPDEVFRRCGNYQKPYLDADSNGGIVVGLTFEGRLVRLMDKYLKSINPNEFCGART